MHDSESLVSYAADVIHKCVTIDLGECPDVADGESSLCYEIAADLGRRGLLRSAAPPPIAETDLRVDVYTSGPARAMRVTHVPSGRVASRSLDLGDSQLQVRDELITELSLRLSVG